MSLADVLDTAPSGVAVFSDGGTTTRDALIEQVRDTSERLRAASVEPGDVVAVQLPNGPDVVATLFGVWLAGAAYAPFNPRAPQPEVDANLAAVRPRVLVTAGGIQPVASAAPLGGGIALVQFTSGTTGPPKPVPLRHDQVLDTLDRVVGSLRADPARPVMPNLVPVSLSLWAGLYQVLFAFRIGAPVVLMDTFTTARFAALVAEHGIRSTVLPPAAMAMLTDDEAITSLAPLRTIRSITAPLSPVQARRFHDRFGVTIVNSYGQTELGGEVVGWSGADGREFSLLKLGSVGRPHPGNEVRLDPASGELLVRTPTSDGWHRTGDLARIDGDGFVWIEGRVSDLIIRGGNKVFPAHVEEVLVSSPDVRDAAVVGVPDDRLGEVPWAFVVPADGVAVDPDALGAWCRERLVPYKVPVRFEPIDELPRNDIGKVLKVALVEQAGLLTKVSETP